MVRHVLYWFVLMLVAVANGALREMVYGPAMAEQTAHQVSTLTGILLTGLAAWGWFRFRPLTSWAQARVVGACWLVMTLIFEFGFGHYVAGTPWERLLQDYDMAAGRLWPLFLLWVLAMPFVFYRVRPRAR